MIGSPTIVHTHRISIYIGLKATPTCPYGWHIINETGYCYMRLRIMNDDPLKSDEECANVHKGATVAHIPNAETIAALGKNVLGVSRVEVWVGSCYKITLQKGWCSRLV